ncbi:MAG: LytTR family transcriptional regulator [Bacteroidia bacterium]|nr:LytTR family transcriptional regulator [Bacteroidia bacterium]
MDNLKTDFPKKLAVPLTDGIEYLNIRDIIRFEADRSYASIFLVTGRKIVVSNKSLNEYEEMLSESHFFRIHRSHLINLEHVSKFIRHDGGYAIMDDKTNLPIARQRKDEFEETMELLIKKNLKR